MNKFTKILLTGAVALSMAHPIDAIAAPGDYRTYKEECRVVGQLFTTTLVIYQETNNVARVHSVHTRGTGTTDGRGSFGVDIERRSDNANMYYYTGPYLVAVFDVVDSRTFLNYPHLQERTAGGFTVKWRNTWDPDGKTSERSCVNTFSVSSTQ